MESVKNDTVQNFNSENMKDCTSLDSYDDMFFDPEGYELENDGGANQRFTPNPLNSSTPCLPASRPCSSIGAGCEWEESWPVSISNSDSCLVSSASNSKGPSPVTPGTSSQEKSPSNATRPFTFSFPQNSNKSLSSITQALQTEKDFMDFVMSFPHNTSNFPLVASSDNKIAANETGHKVGLDHLDNLCKLMEQLSDLKEANMKLRRRVQYLEDIKTLHEIHKEMMFEPTFCSSGLSEDERKRKLVRSDESPKRSASEEKHSPMRHEDVDEDENFSNIYRSNTTTHIDARLEHRRKFNHESRKSGDMTGCKDKGRERSKSVGHTGHQKCKKRLSRWSKVKEVLGIEKAEANQPNGSDEKNSETNSSSCRSVSERAGHSTNENIHKELPRSRSNVLSSSFSKVQRPDAEVIKASKKSETLDCPKAAQNALARMEKNELASKKVKTPWGRMKTMIQIRRDGRHQKIESSSSSSKGERNKLEAGLQDSNHQFFKRNQKTPYNAHHYFQQDDPNLQAGEMTHLNRKNSNETFKDEINETFNETGQKRVITSEKTRRTDSKRQEELPTHSKVDMQNCQKQVNVTRTKSRQEVKSSFTEGQKTPLTHHHESIMKNSRILTDQQKKILENEFQSEVFKTEIEKKRKRTKPRPLTLHDSTVVDSYGHEILFDEEDKTKTPGTSPQNQKKWVWTRVKDAFKMKREDEGRLSVSGPPSPLSENETFDFKEIPKMAVLHSEYASVPGTVYEEKPLNCDSEILSSAPSAAVTELLKEIQQNLSEDFNRKLEEWQKFRSDGVKPPTTEVERKDSFSRFRKMAKAEKKSPGSEKLSKHSSYIHKKDFNWLDKELQKVEREILNLSKEKQKFEKRAFRLKRLKDAVMEAKEKKEVLVKTSAGEFRFEGISNAFTKKLYEWETKKGVGPELSTIALLDESLKKPTDVTVSNLSGSGNSLETTNKFCYQVSRASSEPDLSTLAAVQKEVCPPTQAVRSKSGDTLLENEPSKDEKEDAVENQINEWSSSKSLRNPPPASEECYYSLLEENIFLLDQLKGKEEICSKLQNELDRLDERAEKANRIHQEEMEKYRQKLWEIHMSRPRDLQGSLRLISELKSRIDDLQKCSDNLKLDRQKIEENIRYHSEQQCRLTEDLIHRISEIQDTRLPLNFSRTGHRRKWKKLMKCDAVSVARIHELSTKLLQQAREMEEALAERTRQVCHLRWELLQRDMSAVLLQAALHRVTAQGTNRLAPAVAKGDLKRIKFKHQKAWSIETETAPHSDDDAAEDWLQEKLKQLSLTPHGDWTNIEFSPNEMMTTIHELKKEAIRMLPFRCGNVSDLEEKKKNVSSADSEVADSDRYYDTGSAFNSRSSSFSSGPSCLRGSHSDTRLYERRSSRSASLRRNSSSSMSCISSGAVDASDSSSMQDSDRVHFLARRVLPQWRKTRWDNNASSSCSSRSSVLEDDVNVFPWEKTVAERSDDNILRQLHLKYGSFKEAEEEQEEIDHNSYWGSQCLITPRQMHLSLKDVDGSIGTIVTSTSFGGTYAYEGFVGALEHESSPEYDNLVDINGIPIIRNTKTEIPTRICELNTEAASFSSVQTKKENSSSYSQVQPQKNNSLHEITELSEVKCSTTNKCDTELWSKASSSDVNTKRLHSDFENQNSSISSNFKEECNGETSSSASRQSKCLEPHQSPDITAIKYKGTKHFGKDYSKINFVKDTENRQSSFISGIFSTSGVAVASDRNSEQRLDEDS